MIRIKMEKDRQGRLCGFIVEGHADYAEEGSDIVCAAVSALTQTALLGIIRYAGEEKVVYEQSEGFLAAHTLSFCSGSTYRIGDGCLRIKMKLHDNILNMSC